MRTTKQAAILCLGAAAAAVPAAADDHTPRSLRMRRVAQVPPDGQPGDAPDDPAPPPAADPLPTPPDSSTPTPTHAEQDGKTEVISVTGTTLEHQLFTGRAPVSVITRADLAAAGRATLGDILQSIPTQSNAANAQVNAGGDGTTRINLRGLGAPRTLVLLNGRRIVTGGAGADASVDLNAIPLPVIERVEILKDGASAIYGADAVGGVVNLVTRTEFDGTDASLLTSTSQRGDGTEYAASFVTGFTTNDKRTYCVISGGYQTHASVLAGDRAFSTFQRSYDFATRTETRTTSLAAPSGRLDVLSLGAGGMQPPGCTSNLCKPTADGGWADFVEPGDLYNEAAASYVYTPSTRYNVFLAGGNRLTEHVAVLLEVLYMHRNSDRQLSPVAFSADSPISQFSIYNPLGADIGDYRRRMTELGPRRWLDNVGMTRVIIGLVGDLPGPLDGWKYEVSENYGNTNATLGTTGQLLKARVANAIGPSMFDQSGTPICVRTPGDPSTKVGSGPLEVPCVPLNLLAPAGTIPRDQLKDLTFTDVGLGTDSQRTFLVTMNGPVAKLPRHGDISLSLGGDYRSETGEHHPPAVASHGNTTDDMALPTEGESRVVEGFGELSIVPIAGHDIARWVELDLGARVLHQSDFGSHLTYKVGGLFRTAHGIAVRGTYAKAFRAPSFFDLFGGRTERSVSAEDPCDAKPPSVGDGSRVLDPMVQAQCTAQGVPVGSKLATGQQGVVIGGNRALKPEAAATITVGAVVEPSQVPGVAVSADYWRIAIDDAIETLGVQTIFANCYDRGMQAFCDQIHRDPASFRVRLVDQYLVNVPRTTTSGVDVAVWYDTRLGSLGRIHSGFEAQYLLRYDLDTSLQVLHGVGFYDLGVYPRYRANLSSNWVHAGGASAGLALRYVGSYKECAGNNCNSDHNLAEASRDVGRYIKIDLFGGYQVRSAAGKTTLQVGINNLFDANPPVVYNAAAANSDATTYDFVGRMAYVRLSQQF
jgi:outer membrane receptor protein involved in Fe transport